MIKRKIDINTLKKQLVKGRVNSKSTKYQIVLSYFKHKQDKSIFRVRFPLLVRELLDSLNTYDYVSSQLEDAPLSHPVRPGPDGVIKFDNLELKGLSNEYPIKEILECLFIEKIVDQKTRKTIPTIGVADQKLISFFKKLRDIYNEFCIGDKVLIEESDYPAFYEIFKTEWLRREEKGRETNLQRLEKRITRCLYVFIIMIENNILVAIDEKEKLEKAKEQPFNLQFGTKSEKKKCLKVDKHHHSTCSKNSTQMISNFSIKQISQKSNDELRIEKIDHSQKSMKVGPTATSAAKEIFVPSRFFQKVEVKNLRVKIQCELAHPNEEQFEDDFVDLLSDFMENMLISDAFKLCAKRRKISELFGREHTTSTANPHSGGYYNYCAPNHMYLSNHMYPYSQSYIALNCHLPQMPGNMQYYNNSYSNVEEELHQMRRSVGMFPVMHPYGYSSNSIDTLSVKSRGSQANGQLLLGNSMTPNGRHNKKPGK